MRRLRLGGIGEDNGSHARAVCSSPTDGISRFDFNRAHAAQLRVTATCGADSGQVLGDDRLQSETIAHPDEPYGTDVFWRQAKSIPWRFGGAAAVITATGIANWNWFSSPFRFKSEGWFGKDTANGGMDKLGHAYSAYVLTNFSPGVNKAHRRPDPLLNGGVLSMVTDTYSECSTVFQRAWFSHKTVVDAAGACFVGTALDSGLREKLTFAALQALGRHDRALLSAFRIRTATATALHSLSITDYRSNATSGGEAAV